MKWTGPDACAHSGSVRLRLYCSSIFHVKEHWMTQSAGGPHSSFQLIIQTRPDPFRLLLCVSTLLGKFSLWAKPHVYLALHMAAGLLSAILPAQHDKEWAKLLFQKNRRSHKASGVREVQQVLSWRKWRPPKSCISEGFCCRHPRSQKWESASIPHFDKQVSLILVGHRSRGHLTPRGAFAWVWLLKCLTGNSNSH